MDRGPIPISDDVDLDALMLRVREAARMGPADGIVRELDLLHVLEAQGEWNEHARQSLMALADGIRALRDDWVEVHAGLRREIARLSALVEQRPSPAASRTPRASGSPRGRGTPRPAAKRRPRR